MNTPSAVALWAANAWPVDAAPVVTGGGPQVGLDAVVLADLASMTLDGVPLGLVLHRLAAIAARAVPGVAALSITVVGGRVGGAGFTGPVAAVLDERQHEAGFGPCLHAASSIGEVVVADTAAAATYPAFAALAARHQVASVVSIGLAVPGAGAASLNLYRPWPAGGGPVTMAATLSAARAFAGYAAVVVSNAVALHLAVATAVQLGEAVASRAVIDQAKGVLMAQKGIDAQAAFALLSTASQRTNVKLRQVAARVVASAAGQGRVLP